MANIEKHAPGAFCWIELATTDQEAAKRFYGEIFGWTVNSFPIGPNDFYTIFQLGGRDAAAACTLRPEQTARGVRPHWNLYIAVESADQVAARAAELGGKVLAPPFDVFDAGRMANLQDPTGANFSLWQPKKNRGTGIAGVEGTLCWADLGTPDQARAGQFYADLFGWKMMKEDEDPAHNYWHIKNGEEFIGGIPPAGQSQPGTPAQWTAYFTVSDCDATATKAKQHGAKLYMPPMDFEDVGRMSILADPQGATFAIFKAAARGEASAGGAA
ncbi:MAG TPA: VOC family protein [Candidatus Acidoferrales bacterium]|nr:VOC family protein [Candidatus Acidoferrales bacterium]